MVYECFLDDSKDQTQSRAYVCAGFIGDRSNWSALKFLWRQCLIQNRIRYFKSNEWKQLTGEFARFKTSDYPPPEGRNAANKIREQLLAAAKCVRGIVAFGVMIPVEVYIKVGQRPQAEFFGSANPYRRALEGVFNRAMQEIEASTGNHEVVFIHDNGPDWNDLEAYYNEYKELNPRHAQRMKGFIPSDDKDRPELQLADAFANEALYLSKEWLKGGGSPVQPKRELFNMWQLEVWNEQIMLCILKKNLLAKGLPIPADLESPEYD